MMGCSKPSTCVSSSIGLELLTLNQEVLGSSPRGRTYLPSHVAPLMRVVIRFGGFRSKGMRPHLKHHRLGGLAQSGSASVWHTEGHGFKSRILHESG